MKKHKQDNNRRDFLKKLSLSATPFLVPTIGMQAMSSNKTSDGATNKSISPVNFVYDGMAFSPQEYIEKLNEINKTAPISPDFYGNGGATQLLEKEFAKLTGKEKAIYLPTGTMANQIAIKLLNKDNTKVIVPENSHIFRDEADAAQSVHNKRLIPVGKNKSYFELTDLKNAVDYISKNEVFKSGLGTVVIENPVRRANGTLVPIKTIQEIANYCKQNGYKMHLDGARIHLASAYTNISLSEYASYFDTVYISLYKYLNAAGGAILCGDAAIIDKIKHQIKIYGGTVFQTWNNTSMALHYLNGLQQRWELLLESTTKLLSELNKIDGISINSIDNGTNIYHLQLADTINQKKLTNSLYTDHNIILGKANENGIIKFAINESLLTRDLNKIINAWQTSITEIQG